jgi:hypothetical protein
MRIAKTEFKIALSLARIPHPHPWLGNTNEPANTLRHYILVQDAIAETISEKFSEERLHCLLCVRRAGRVFEGFSTGPLSLFTRPALKF